MLDVLEIELLAHIIAEKRGAACNKDCLECVYSGCCIYRDIAEICINEGYLPAATVRAEAIEEFAERLKAMAHCGEESTLEEDMCVDVIDIDELLKEMTEGPKNDGKAEADR